SRHFVGWGEGGLAISLCPSLRLLRPERELGRAPVLELPIPPVIEIPEKRSRLSGSLHASHLMTQKVSDRHRSAMPLDPHDGIQRTVIRRGIPEISVDPAGM